RRLRMLLDRNTLLAPARGAEVGDELERGVDGDAPRQVRAGEAPGGAAALPARLTAPEHAPADTLELKAIRTFGHDERRADRPEPLAASGAAVLVRGRIRARQPLAPKLAAVARNSVHPACALARDDPLLKIAPYEFRVTLKRIAVAPAALPGVD